MNSFDMSVISDITSMNCLDMLIGLTNFGQRLSTILAGKLQLPNRIHIVLC